jgi:hypothetical protein
MRGVIIQVLKCIVMISVRINFLSAHCSTPPLFLNVSQRTKKKKLFDETDVPTN